MDIPSTSTNAGPKRKRKRRDQNKSKNPAVSGVSLNVCEIPLPPKGEEPEIPEGTVTERHYDGKDFMFDAPCTEKYTGAIEYSKRYVVPALEAMELLLKKYGTTVETVAKDFEEKAIKRLQKDRELQENVPFIEIPSTHSKCKCGQDSSEDESSSSESSESEDSENEDQGQATKKEKESFKYVSYVKQMVDRKRNHPNAVSPDMIFNEKGWANDAMVCRCSFASRTKGINHGYFAGEDCEYHCDPETSNHENLYHYFLRVTPSPDENQIYKTSFFVLVEEFNFEGFSILTHKPLPERMTKMPISKWSIEYEFQFVAEPIPPECYIISDCDLLTKYVFHDVFEMLDFDLTAKHLKPEKGACSSVHLMPRFVSRFGPTTRLMPTKGVLAYFLSRFEPLFDDKEVKRLLTLSPDDFFKQTSRFKQNIVVRGDKKPCAIRVDSFEQDFDAGKILFVHNNMKPVLFSSVNFPRMQYLERRINRNKHLEQATGKPSEIEEMIEFKRELEELKAEMKNFRAFVLHIPSDGYCATGFFPDCVAHLLMSILAIHHARYQMSLNVFEQHIGYRFNNRSIIEQAFSHISFKANYGTNIDHAKTLISNCGYRRKYLQEERKDKKRGIVNLLTIMSSTGKTQTGQMLNNMPVNHNERLEYLGDAVVEMIVTNHMFFMLPYHNEGGLATYRTSLVQNRNLATLAKNIRLDEFVQFAHGIELCHEADFRHALANTFEAVMGAIFLDSGMEHCDRIFSFAMYMKNDEKNRRLKEIWDHVNEHELKRDQPMGDRDLANSVPTLENLKKLEERVGIRFNNIRLLAKAFTRRNVPFNELTRGHNQRLEWLGDTVLQLVISDYLYRNFPYHHEGHLSLLRTNLVSNMTQSKICEDLGFPEFVIKPAFRVAELRMKDKADLVEAFIGALYVDRGLEHCRSFVRITFLPRFMDFIDNDKWNDPKSHLQQWCLTLREGDSTAPTLPEYRKIRIEGPTNTRLYRVAVYFKNRKLGVGDGPNIHTAEIKAAENALESNEGSDFRRLRESLKMIKAQKSRRRSKKSRGVSNMNRIKL